MTSRSVYITCCLNCWLGYILVLSSNRRRSARSPILSENIPYYQLIDTLAHEGHDTVAHWIKCDSVYWMELRGTTKGGKQSDIIERQHSSISHQKFNFAYYIRYWSCSSNPTSGGSNAKIHGYDSMPGTSTFRYDRSHVTRDLLIMPLNTIAFHDQHVSLRIFRSRTTALL